jgi:hypothetical protein
MQLVRTACKYFVCGLLVGLFFAPRSGDETRRAIISQAGQFFGGLFGVRDDRAGA